jgi:hypothetical protein
MLDAGSYEVAVYANPGADDIYNTESASGVAAFAVLPAGGSEEKEFVVSSVEDLLTAIDAGKRAITLKYSDIPYEIGALTVTTPIHLKGQVSGDKLTKIAANVTMSGEIGGSVIFENFEFCGNGASVLIDDKNNAPVVDTVALINCYLHDTKALYDNSGKAASDVQFVVFDKLFVDNCSNGADFIDMRAGAHHNLIIVNSTFANSARTFVRTDAGHEMNRALIRNNTFYKLCTNSTSKDNNGLFHIRSAAGLGLNDYRIQKNIFYSILIDVDPENAAGYPRFISKNTAAIKPTAIMCNYFYNIEEREERSAYSWWTVNCSREEGLKAGGAILATDPFANAEAGDFTLVNSVAMNAGVGDPRWNPMAGSDPASEITVENVGDLLTAISAGKSTITLKEGEYDFTSVDNTDVANGKLTLVKSLNLIGEKGSTVTLIGGFIFKEGCQNFTASNIIFNGNSAIDNAFEVGAAEVVMKKFAIENSNIVNFKNRLFYMNVAAAVTAVEFNGDLFAGTSGADFTSGDFIDIRKGNVSALKFVNNTVQNCVRTFARIDAAVVLESMLVRNNTFYNLCYVDSKDNNGIFHVRATSIPESEYKVENNLFASMHRAAEAPSNANGYPKIVSTNTASKIPTFRHNYFYDVDEGEEFSFWTKDRITPETALAGNGVMLTVNPFFDVTMGDYTLVSDLAKSENIGDPRWNDNRGTKPGELFAVNNVEELKMAIDAGKNAIRLNFGEYDLTAVEEWAGSLPVISELTLTGVEKCGEKPVVIGGIKISESGAISVNDVLFRGYYGEGTTISAAITVAEAAECSFIKMRKCEFDGFANKLLDIAKECKVKAVDFSGLYVHDVAGTGGDFIDIRKGSVGSVSVTNSTFANGIRTFIRMDAAVVCGSVKVANNTFYNLCSIDSKDNNGILHVRSTTVLADTRQYMVVRNIFATMHRAAEAPSNANGFPKLVSTASEKLGHPTFEGNLYYDFDTAEGFSWWNTIGEEAAVAGGGAVLAETPFAGDPAAGKFTVKPEYKGYGDTTR